MAIEAVIFDAENVLYDGTAWWRWLVGVLRHLGRAIHYQTFCQTWHEQYWNDVCLGLRPHSEAFRAFLADNGLTESQIDEVEAAAAAQRHRLASPLRAFQGVRSTLDLLQQRSFALGVLANSDLTSEQLRSGLARMGLRHFFDSVLSSRDLGYCKPATEAYLAGLEDVGTNAEQTAFVAHDQQELNGAAHVGLVTIAFNYPAGTQAEFHANRFCEVASLLSEATQRVPVST